MSMVRPLILLVLASTLNQATPADLDPVAFFRHGNYRLALRLFLARARNCDYEAQNYVGIMYHLGLATTRDLTAAAYWYRQAAEAGSSDAPRNFAILLSDGKGIVQNHLQAYGWLDIARQRGSRNADRALDSMSDKLTANQVMRAKAWARQFLVARRPKSPDGSKRTLGSCG